MRKIIVLLMVLSAFASAQVSKKQSSAPKATVKTLNTGTTITHQVSLSWVQSTSAGVTGNNVYRGTTTGGPYTIISTGATPVTGYIDTAVNAGTTYYYVVTATCSTCNPTESAYSPEAQALVPNNAPAPPPSLTATPQ